MSRTKCYICDYLNLPDVGSGGYMRSSGSTCKRSRGKQFMIKHTATKLSPLALSLLEPIGTLYKVTQSDTINDYLLKAAYRIGCYMQREMQYDFPVFDRKALCVCGSGTKVLYFFMVEDKVIGAISFAHHSYNNVPKPMWELQFVYIIPQYRRIGLLNQAWVTLVQEHSPFLIQEPISEALGSFLINRVTNTITIQATNYDKTIDRMELSLY